MSMTETVNAPSRARRQPSSENTPPQAPLAIHKRTRRRIMQQVAVKTVLHVLAGTLGLLLTLPFVWMLLTSLKTLGEVDAPGWIPEVFQWHNYAEVFKVIPFGRFYANSLVVAGWVTVLQVLTSAMAAYSFSRLNWPGRDKIFMAYLATMMLPGLVMIVPNYQIMIELRLVDTLIGLVLPGAFSAFGTFLLRQFMLSIPTTIDEAAEIDGASKWRVFWEIILPLSRPGLIVLTIFCFMGTYNSFFWPLVMLRSTHKFTLPVGLLFFESQHSSATHQLMAAVTMSVIPAIILFMVLQKYLVRGIQLGGVKG